MVLSLSSSLKQNNDKQNNDKQCIGQDDQIAEFNEKLNEFNNMYLSIQTKQCEIECVSDNKIESTQNSRICKDPDNPNKLIKQSYLLDQTNIFINRSTSDYLCEDLISAIDYTMNETKNNQVFSKLREVFPQHFINIEVIEELCIASGKRQNVYKMDYVQGTLLNNFISDSNTDDLMLKNIIKQIVYVLIYMNVHGYYHNDIKLDNIMIENITPTNLSYNQFDIQLELNEVKNIFKLIDYSTGVIIPDVSILEVQLIDPIVILVEIKNCINKLNANSRFVESLKLIYTILKKLGELEQLEKLGELKELVNTSTPNLRLLNKQGIMEKSVKISKDKLYELVQLLNTN